ncbi:MAG: hypothetical protein VKL39_24030 [Leptolyngbyaceae bacterium]|nr:hypothetical protein [Leptolyngbyaceae bacterium]
MTTVDSLITQLRSHPMLGGRRPTLDQLNGAINGSVTTLTVTVSNPLIRPGTFIEIGYELMYVVAATLPSVTVIRGVEGTTAASQSDDAIITVQPRWTRQQFLEAIQEEIWSWPPDLCAIATVEVTFSADRPRVDLSGASGRTVRRLYRAETQRPSTYENNRRVDLEFLTRQDTGDYPSGTMLQLAHGTRFIEDTVVRVTYGYEFDASALVSTTNLLTGTGLTRGLLQALKAGVMWRLLLNSEAELTSAGAAAPPNAIQPTHRVQAAQAAREDRDRLLAMEVRRVYDEFGVTGA